MDLPLENHFPTGIFNYFYTIYIHINHNNIAGKYIFVPFQNGAQINDFRFASFRASFDFGENFGEKTKKKKH